ncbi:MAG: hypothetical protein Q4B48_01640 [Syntrophomonadaceae bacterium]|nr:hypothetical protein [Syntrophomonadaceae bacterium]
MNYSYWVYMVVAVILILMGIKNLRKVYGEGMVDASARRLRLINGWMFTVLGVAFMVLGVIKLLQHYNIPLF